MGTRRGIAAALGALGLALALAACGGEGDNATRAQPTRPPPALPAKLGAELAAASDEVAVLLAQNDPCAAQAKARELSQRATQAVVDGRVPAALRKPLLAAAQRLEARIACEPQEDENDEPGRGRKKGKGKDENSGEGGDD
jgi:hypothetical protein